MTHVLELLAVFLGATLLAYFVALVCIVMVAILSYKLITWLMGMFL